MSDLANESLDSLTKGVHYDKQITQYETIIKETFHILKEHQSIQQRVGTYVEISFEDYRDLQIPSILKETLQQFLKKYKTPKILIVGLGNQYLTCDAIGPRSLRDLRVTHYLNQQQRSEQHFFDIMAIVPGVMVHTGMESSDIVKAIVEKKGIDVVIAIDALCAKSYSKLASVIQVNNVGILPGGGIKNHRKAINKEIIGCDVIALGVPTVVYASSLVKEVLTTTIDYFGDQINQKNILKIGKRKKYDGNLSTSQKEMMLGHLGTLNESELEYLFQEVLTPIDRNMVLSDKQIDEQCTVLAKYISQSINDLRC